MADKKDYTDVLLADISSKFDAVLEAVGGMQDQIKKIPRMAERIEKLGSDMLTVKIAVRTISNDTELIKIRTEKLEQLQDEVNDVQKRVKAIESAA